MERERGCSRGRDGSRWSTDNNRVKISIKARVKIGRRDDDQSVSAGMYNGFGGARVHVATERRPRAQLMTRTTAVHNRQRSVARAGIAANRARGGEGRASATGHSDRWSQPPNEAAFARRFTAR